MIDDTCDEQLLAVRTPKGDVVVLLPRALDANERRRALACVRLMVTSEHLEVQDWDRCHICWSAPCECARITEEAKRDFAEFVPRKGAEVER